MLDRIATVLGATGFIGQHLLDALQADSQFTTIRAVVRRPQRFRQTKVDMRLVSFDEPESVKMAIDGSNAVFCAVGTTQKRVAGNKELYRRVDFDIPVMAARFCEETGCPRFLLVSAVGADKSSRNFYLQLKGEVEEAVQRFSVESIGIFRPSILLGDRTESRPAERVGQGLASFFGFLFVGGWEKYRGIDGEKVANAMVQAAKEAHPGVSFYEYAEMQLLLKRLQADAAIAHPRQR